MSVTAVVLTLDEEENVVPCLESLAWADRRVVFDSFSDDRTEFGADLLTGIPDADVYNLHWVGGFVDWAAVLPGLAERAPLVWTLSDLNALTGGCHYDHGCGRYREACGACPQLGSDDLGDRTAVILRRKLETLARLQPGALRMVAGSRWLADRVRESRMGDRVAVMKEGEIQQVDDPTTVYESPSNHFVGGFLGNPPMNFLDGRVEANGHGVRVMVGGHELRPPESIGRMLRDGASTTVTLGIRAENIETTASAVDEGFPVRVHVVELS